MTARPALVLCCLALAALAPALPHDASEPSAEPSSAAATSEAGPRLVVFISVDQMRADYLERFRPLFTGGLKRLAEQGAVFTNARFRHASTETGPGHSVLLSGRNPRSSGIVANAWYDRALRRRVNVVEDSTVRVLGGAGRTASPALFQAFTVGDMLKTRSPRSRVVGVSFKDRAAILMAGRRADGAYWYESSGGNFVTSSWYTAETPRWLESWNARRLSDGFATRPWERLLPEESPYLRLAGPDHVDGEWDRKDTVFPHRVRNAPPAIEYYDDLRRTPFADELLLEFAQATLAAHDLGSDDATDLLAVGFSACDVVGHTYGPDSQEQMDQMLRLDRTLGRFFDAVEARAGKGRWLAVLTADHGVMPLVEVLRSRGIDARRAAPEDLLAPVQAALAARFPDAGQLLLDAEDPLEMVLDREAIARHGQTLEAVESVVREALLGTGLIDAVYTSRQLMGAAPADDPFFDMHQRAFFAPRSGDLISRVKPYVYVGGRVGGTGHGTPHDYDRHVPIVFLGPGIAPGEREDACGPEDIAWALGRLLGLPYPQQDAVVDLLPLVKSGS
jgi:predicted AlkP superfamily pyrophosphatase or phosphodiesterase